MKIAVTGARGFIGGAFTAAARRAGHDVLALGRGPATQPGEASWALGELLPAAAADADLVLHLASATLGSREPKQAFELDVEGSRILIEQTRRLRREGRGPRLLFVSSQSADPSAVNLYGRSKWAIESMLAEADEVIVRPGLVYGEAPVSVYAALSGLAALPIVPVVSGPAAIHPIHVDDLADCLLQIATLAAPERLWRLGAAPGMTLAQLLAGVARRQGHRPPIALPLPRPLVRLAARGVDLALRPPASMLERVDGLIGLKPMDSSESLRRLGRTLRPFSPAS